MVNDLDELRKDVREIDREIINLIGKRSEITRKIGKRKKEEGIPLRNWDVEKVVIDNAVEVADELGISVGLIKSIMQQLIVESRIQQEILHYSAYRGDKENILIIGGLGEMGQWFSYFFQNQGHNVSIYDIKGKSRVFQSYQSLNQGIKGASCVLIAASLEVVPKIIDELTSLRFKGIVFDIASLKDCLIDSIKGANKKGISITSIHPMFGSNARTLSDKVICFCDCGSEEANRRVETFFKATAISIVKLPLDEHDRAISYVLGLSHIVNIIFMKALMAGGYKYKELDKIASTTFLSQMATASSVIKENPHLYYAIQRFNPFKQELYENLTSVVKAVTNIVLSENEEKFMEIMETGRRWLED